MHTFSIYGQPPMKMRLENALENAHHSRIFSYIDIPTNLVAVTHLAFPL